MLGILAWILFAVTPSYLAVTKLPPVPLLCYGFLSAKVWFLMIFDLVIYLQFSHLSGMLLHGWLNWLKKLLVPLCFQEKTLLYLQYVLLLFLKCRIYNSGSALFQVLCTSLAPHIGLMCDLWLVSNGLRPWWLMAPKVFYCSQMHPTKFLALIYWVCILMVWGFSKRFNLSIGVFPICALRTYCQLHWDPIKSDFYMSWYTSLTH